MNTDWTVMCHFSVPDMKRGLYTKNVTPNVIPDLYTKKKTLYQNTTLFANVDTTFEIKCTK